jgi:hypothetical protein
MPEPKAHALAEAALQVAPEDGCAVIHDMFMTSSICAKSGVFNRQQLQADNKRKLPNL